MERNLSIIDGSDGECIDTLMEIHSSYLEDVILDVTFNEGKMWKKSRYYPNYRMDINSSYPVNLCASYDKLPFADNSFTAIFYDPPHLPNHADSVHSSKIWKKTYGLSTENIYGNGDNVSSGFMPFLLEAKRVLKKHGLILCKIADLNHNHKYQWQHVDFIRYVQEVGMTPCDMIIKTSPSSGRLTSSKWENVYHVRKSHSYWICVRNSDRCERLKNLL